MTSPVQAWSPPGAFEQQDTAQVTGYGDRFLVGGGLVEVATLGDRLRDLAKRRDQAAVQGAVELGRQAARADPLEEI